MIKGKLMKQRQAVTIGVTTNLRDYIIGVDKSVSIGESDPESWSADSLDTIEVKVPGSSAWVPASRVQIRFFAEDNE